MGILDLGAIFQLDLQTLTYPTAGNCPMLTSDQDLDDNHNRRFSRSPSLPYPTILTELNIDRLQVIRIFNEATSQAIRLTDAPVAVLMATGISGCQIGSIGGLEQFVHLPPQPNLLAELAGLEYFYAQVMSGKSGFRVTDCHQHSQLARLAVCQVHGVRAYLGLPIVTTAKDRLGTLAILDFKPRQFSDRDISTLQVVSRLVASEFERKLLSQSQLNCSIGDLQYRGVRRFDDAIAAAEHQDMAANQLLRNHQSSTLPDLSSSQLDLGSIYPQVQGEIQFKLLTHLSQELLTPLTSILGMASVLQQEIYGPLSSKQKDYLAIIHHSGQQLVTIVDEISQLSGTNCQQSQLNLVSVDLEMLCQLTLQSLEPLAQKKQQQISLGFTTGSSPLEPRTERVWLIDKAKVRQIIYYLCLSLIHASTNDAQISIEISTLVDELQVQILTNDAQAILPKLDHREQLDLKSVDRHLNTQPNIAQDLRLSLGLSIGHALAVSHGGKIEVIANPQGYQLTLPRIITD